MSQRGDHIFVTTESNVNHGDPLIIANDQNAIIIDGGAQRAKFQLNGSNLEMSRNGGSSALSIRADGSTDLWGNVQFNKHLTTYSQADMTVSYTLNSGTINSKTGNDIRGSIAFTPSTTGPAQIKITFNKPFQTVPIVIVTPTNGVSSVTNMFVIATQLEYVIIELNIVYEDEIHNFNYFVIG
jgi:hypothetical protein